jgi:hypothetical protein
VSALYHRRSGGNHPHVHHHHAAGKSHHHDHENKNENRHSHGYGDHAYDVNGNEAPIVASDPHRLEHWHFDLPFESFAIAPISEVGTGSSPTVVPPSLPRMYGSNDDLAQARAKNVLGCLMSRVSGQLMITAVRGTGVHGDEVSGKGADGNRSVAVYSLRPENQVNR